MVAIYCIHTRKPKQPCRHANPRWQYALDNSVTLSFAISISGSEHAERLSSWSVYRLL